MLRITHKKLVQSYSMLMAMFTNGATKWHYEGKDSYLCSHVTSTVIDNSKPVAYSQSEYPLIKYWTRQQWKENENNNKDISDLLGNKDKTCRETRSVRGENVIMLYIEHIDGTPIDSTMVAEI